MAEPDEPLDVYDELGTRLGVAPRSVVHRDGLWHRCVHLWVVSGDAVLLQRRGAHKASWPGRLDATAAGHVGAGESVQAGGAREILEELGVAYAPSQLADLGVRPLVDRSGGLDNREFQHVWLVSDPRPLEAWTAFDRSELDGLVRVGLSDFVALVHGRDGEPWPGQAWDGERVRDVVLHRDELVPAPYLPEVAGRLERLARGEDPPSI